MAKGKKTGGRDFTPGVVTNPHGRPPMPPELKAVRKLNRHEVEICLSKIIKMGDAEREFIILDPESSGMEKITARIVTEAIKCGDEKRLGFLFDRLVGKVQDKVEVTMPKPTVIQRRNGEVVELGSEMKENEE